MPDGGSAAKLGRIPPGALTLPAMERLMKVLVVDDDVVSRMVLMHLIDSCGVHDIVEAEDGAAA